MILKKVSILTSFNLSFHWFAMGIIIPIIPIMSLFLLEKGYSLVQITMVFVAYSTTTVILELPTGSLADSIVRKKVYLISLLLQLIGAIFLLVINGFKGAARFLSSGARDAHFIDEFSKIDPKVDYQKDMANLSFWLFA
ncbi:MAG: MFS transporter [bacterium]|nr:MFS transporter [bacterium]